MGEGHCEIVAIGGEARLVQGSLDTPIPGPTGTDTPAPSGTRGWRQPGVAAPAGARARLRRRAPFARPNWMTDAQWESFLDVEWPESEDGRS